MDVGLLILIIGVVLGLPAAILHDRLLRHQYLYHRNAWEADGCFDGLFWHVDGAVSAIQAKGFQPRNWGRTAWLWLYHTPAWIDAPPPCRRILYASRIVTVLYLVAFVVVMIKFLTTTPASNQAMQRTASKPAIDFLGVCHPPLPCVGGHSGLAVADLVSR
jgi:hypothetical protein